MDRKGKKLRISSKLSIRRRDQSPPMFEDEEVLEETEVEVIDVDPKMEVKPNEASIVLSSGHSTPIQNKKRNTSVEQSPELNYQGSPIMPLSQNPNEVAWDWQTKDLNRTPKRTILLPKRRNSNSPLLKPLKRKLIRSENKESLAEFTNMMRAMSEQIMEKNVEIPPAEESDVESQLVVEIDTNAFNESEIRLEVSEISEGSVEKGPQKKESVTFDDSIDESIEAFMVRCSQEIEERFLARNMPHPTESAPKQKRAITPNSSIDTVKSEESKSFLNSSYVIDVSSASTSKDLSSDKSDAIPDDSIDDLLLSIDCTKPNDSIAVKNLNKCEKTYVKPHNVYKSSGAALKNLQIAEKTSQQNFGLKTSLGSANSSGIGSSGTSSWNNPVNKDVRLLKMKSYSDSSFSQSDGAKDEDSGQSKNKFFTSKRRPESCYNFPSETAGGKPKVWGRSLSGCMDNKKSVNNEFSNAIGTVYSSSSYPSINDNFSKLNTKDDGKSRFLESQSSQPKSSQTHFTPEEIERKRQEAIMKRKARLKMTKNDQLSKTASGRPVQLPVKR